MLHDKTKRVMKICRKENLQLNINVIQMNKHPLPWEITVHQLKTFLIFFDFETF